MLGAGVIPKVGTRNENLWNEPDYPFMKLHLNTKYDLHSRSYDSNILDHCLPAVLRKVIGAVDSEPEISATV